MRVPLLDLTDQYHGLAGVRVDRVERIIDGSRVVHVSTAAAARVWGCLDVGERELACGAKGSRLLR